MVCRDTSPELLTTGAELRFQGWEEVATIGGLPFGLPASPASLSLLSTLLL